jgi:hypothetical protein
MHRSAIFIAAALASAVTPAIAHARHASDERPYAGDERPYAGYERPEASAQEVRLAEVSADPRDGADTVALGGLGGFTHLELRAREALVDIHGLGLRLRDGRTEWIDARMRIAPGQQRTIELPPDARRAEAIVVDYGDPAARRRDRTPARLEIYGATAGDCDDAAVSERPYAYERAPRRLDRPAYDDGAPYDRSGRRIPLVVPGGRR